MILQEKTLQTGGLKGCKDNAIIPPDIDPNRIAYTLSTTSRYLLEAAWGPYALTLSHQLHSQAQAAALLSLASHITPIPMALSANAHDLGACIMVQAASLLSKDGTLVFVPSNGRPIGGLSMRSNGNDERTFTLLESGMLTDRSRMDVGYMRQRLASCAKQYEREALADGRQPEPVVSRLALMAGDPWPRVAGTIRWGVAA